MSNLATISETEVTLGDESRLYTKVGPFFMHEGFRGCYGKTVLTVPCGAMLGPYKNKKSAKTAAKIFETLPGTNWEGTTLDQVFGDQEARRRAWDAVKHLTDY